MSEKIAFNCPIFLKRRFILLLLTLCCSQILSAEDLVIIKVKMDETPFYSTPDASTVEGVKQKDDLKDKTVKNEAMNGRLLQIDDGVWIKAKYVKTDKKFDVGACEKSNKSTGTRAAVNCTE